MCEGTYVLPGEPQSYISRIERYQKEWSENKAAHYKSIITLQSQHGDQAFFKGPLDVSIKFYFKTPVHASRRAKVGKLHTESPTVIFLYKFVEEVSRSIMFERYNTIVHLELLKMYDDTPRTEIHIKEISDDKGK